MKPKLYKAGLLTSLWLVLSLGLSACDEIEGVDYLRMGHPADPQAASGKTARMSRALTPENINVRPDLGGNGSATLRRQKSPDRMNPASRNPATMNHRGSH